MSPKHFSVCGDDALLLFCLLQYSVFYRCIVQVRCSTSSLPVSSLSKRNHWDSSLHIQILRSLFEVVCIKCTLFTPSTCYSHGPYLTYLSRLFLKLLSRLLAWSRVQFVLRSWWIFCAFVFLAEKPVPSRCLPAVWSSSHCSDIVILLNCNLPFNI